MEELALENKLLKQQLEELQLKLQTLTQEGRQQHHLPVQHTSSQKLHKSLQFDSAAELSDQNSSSSGYAETRPVPLSQSCSLQDHKLTFLQTHTLTKEQVQRYSRHLLLPNFGIDAQSKLCSSCVLVIGCGGLGSPAALYLAAAGVGKLGLVDHDTVDATNLHRQIIHTEARVGVHKALSAQSACQAINSSIQFDPLSLLGAPCPCHSIGLVAAAPMRKPRRTCVVAHTEGLNPQNALELVDQYDVVVDASDNPATRYLVSDACVVSGKPLVSAAAVGTDGQLTVYNYGEDGPCYRCLFPESPAPENCSRCGDAGVLGVVPGIMGSLQALEAIKVITGCGDVLSKKLTIFDALAGRFTTVKLRAKTPKCIACGSQPMLRRDTLASYDYVAFTGQGPNDGPPIPLKLLSSEYRVTPGQVQQLLATPHTSGSRVPILLDVRPEPQYRVMHLPSAVHVPFDSFHEHAEQVLQLCGIGQSKPHRANGCDVNNSTPDHLAEGSANSGNDAGNGLTNSPDGAHDRPPVIVLCRRGNNSQIIVQELHKMGVVWARDMIGGMTEWAQTVDQQMPVL